MGAPRPKIKGAVPPRTDVDVSGMDVCAQKAMAALKNKDTRVPRLSAVLEKFSTRRK